MPKYLVALGWLASTVLALLIVYGPFPYWDPENVEVATTVWHSRLYGALHRYVWGLVIAWIVFACVNGDGGAVNDFLSWKAFLPLGRISFCLYIGSWVVQLAYCLTQSLHPVYAGPYYMVRLTLLYLSFATA